MADYSKEYGFDWADFSIKEEFEKLNVDYTMSMICEGFGFIAVGNIGGVCCVAMPRKDDPEHFDWLKFCFETNKILNEIVEVKG